MCGKASSADINCKCIFPLSAEDNIIHQTNIFGQKKPCTITKHEQINKKKVRAFLAFFENGSVVERGVFRLDESNSCDEIVISAFRNKRKNKGFLGLALDQRVNVGRWRRHFERN